MEKKIVQLMPLRVDRLFPPGRRPTFVEEDETTNESVTWYIIGGALMDDGNVQPLCWDGFWRFKTVDREKRQLIRMTEKAIKRAEMAYLDEVAYIKKYGHPSWMADE